MQGFDLWGHLQVVEGHQRRVAEAWQNLNVRDTLERSVDAVKLVLHYLLDALVLVAYYQGQYGVLHWEDEQVEVAMEELSVRLFSPGAAEEYAAAQFSYRDPGSGEEPELVLILPLTLTLAVVSVLVLVLASACVPVSVLVVSALASVLLGLPVSQVMDR